MVRYYIALKPKVFELRLRIFSSGNLCFVRAANVLMVMSVDEISKIYRFGN